MGIGDKSSGDVLIDHAATAGLAGTRNSLAYRIHEIERHLHSWERWFAAAAVAVGETHVADRINDSQTPFRLDGGNDTWGSWVQILGSTDLPVIVGRAKYDIHKLVFNNITSYPFFRSNLPPIRG